MTSHTPLPLGYAIQEDLFSPEEVAFMISQVEASNIKGAGSRSALAWPWVQEVASDPRIRNLVGDARPVRAILFDKTPGANWNLGFHQDRAIPLTERIEVRGFGGWSEKDGVPHAIAPAEVLERMIAVRISLDDCGDDNGPLRVIPRTHELGLIARSEVSRLLAENGEIACLVGAGGVVLMKPLTLHASSAASSPRYRRILHIEFYEGDLPGGLTFYDWCANGRQDSYRV